MNRIAAITLFVAATLITAGSAMAQDHSVKATVPFTFTVSGSSLPAGNYTIASDSVMANVLTIANRGKKLQILAMGQTGAAKPGTGELVFHKYGAQYFLSEIRYAGYSRSVRFPASKMEKRAKSRIEEASLPANNEVMIALN